MAVRRDDCREHEHESLSRCVALIARTAIACVVLGQTTNAVTAQPRQPSAAKSAWSPARTPDGQPDIQGLWQTQGGNLTVSLEPGAVTLAGSDFVAFLDAGSAGPDVGPIGIVDPPDGRIPLQSWALARRKEIADHYQDPKGNLSVMDPSARCLAAGVPRVNYVTPYNGYQSFRCPAP